LKIPRDEGKGRIGAIRPFFVLTWAIGDDKSRKLDLFKP
jgi:hypothetical protein